MTCPHSLNYHTDVSAATPANGDVLAYDSATEIWVPVTPAAGAVLTPHVLGFHSDVDTAGAITNQVLGYDGTEWVPMAIGASGPLALNDLTDVLAVAPGAGDVITWNGLNWVPVANGALTAHALNFHSDVSNVVPLNGQVLTYNTGAAEWQATNGGGGSLDGLSDVVAPAPAAGQFLTWNGANWIPGAAPGLSTHTLNFHSDVNAPAPNIGDVLTWNGVTWGSAASGFLADLNDLNDVVCPSPALNHVLAYDGTNWVCGAPTGVQGQDELNLKMLRGAVTKAAGATNWTIASGTGYTVLSGAGGNSFTIGFDTAFADVPVPTIAHTAAQVTNGGTTFNSLQPVVGAITAAGATFNEQWHSNPGNVVLSPGIPATTDITVYFTFIGL